MIQATLLHAAASAASYRTAVSMAAAACPSVLSWLSAPSRNAPYLGLRSLSSKLPTSAGQGSRLMASLSAAEHADALKPKMLCYQCEQTANGTGCTVMGQCGKSAEVAGLQDLQVFTLKGLGSLAHYARTVAGLSDPEVDSHVLQAAFATLTNVNFDDSRFEELINRTLELHARLAGVLKAAGHALPTAPPSGATPWFEAATGHPLVWNTSTAATAARDGPIELPELLELAKHTGIIGRQEVLGKTVAGLQELVMYGLKGLCAYAAHADALGARDDAVHAAVHSSLAFLSSPEASDPETLLKQALAVGEANLRVMAMLSDAHASRFGHPVPTEVPLVPRPGKCILVTGHDMQDMYDLLKQTEGTGVQVYTHGEMLPAHSYPGLKKFGQLAGHYGGAWYRQKFDFSYWPGAILATTNCVLEPMSMYRLNLFTTNETGLPNVAHVHGQDFSAVIRRAQELPGWTERTLPRVGARGGPAKAAVTVGYGHHAVLSVADKVVGAIKDGQLRHIFLVGGCDGHEPQRAYYAQLGQNLPKDTMLLTLGCGKFRLIDQEFGTLGNTGLPRLLDMGQCNDAHSALVVASALAKALDTDINSLPLSLDISWFEQKAVAVLLSLLHLGVNNIRLGPQLPAFLTPEAASILVQRFGIKPADTSNPELDLAKMMARA